MDPRPLDPPAARRIRAALAAAGDDGPVPCPRCGSPLAARAVVPPPNVSYVRDRVRVHCPGCGLSGAVDLRGDDPARRPGGD